MHLLAVLSLSKGFLLRSSLWSCSVAGRRYDSQPNASARLALASEGPHQLMCNSELWCAEQLKPFGRLHWLRSRLRSIQ